MTRFYDEESLGALLRILQPAPTAWVRAAQELPGARRSLDEIVSRAEADLEFRAALIAALQKPLAQEGFEPERHLIEELKKRFSET